MEAAVYAIHPGQLIVQGPPSLMPPPGIPLAPPSQFPPFLAPPPGPHTYLAPPPSTRRELGLFPPHSTPPPHGPFIGSLVPPPVLPDPIPLPLPLPHPVAGPASSASARSSPTATPSSADLSKTQSLPNPPLSRFAPRYVPLWLRQTNLSRPLHSFHLSGSPRSEVEAKRLVEDIYPAKLDKELRRKEEEHQAKVIAIIQSYERGTDDDSSASTTEANRSTMSRRLAPVAPETYAAHWLPVHKTEYEARAAELERAAMYAVPIRRVFLADSSVASTTSKPRNEPNGTSRGEPRRRRTNLYSIPTPFIRESHPPISLGDTCLLRPVVSSLQCWRSVEVEAEVWAVDRVRGVVTVKIEERRDHEPGEGTDASGDESWGPGWAIFDQLFEVEVEAKRAQREDGKDRNIREGRSEPNDDVTVGGEGPGADADVVVEVNVIWRIQDQIFLEWKRASEIVDLHLQESRSLRSSAAPKSASSSAALGQTSSGSALRRETFDPSTGAPGPSGDEEKWPIETWLFPERSDLDRLRLRCQDPTARVKERPEMTKRRWVDPKLNAEQKNAVESILWAQHRLPLIISGPPGTGKTKTLVEAVFQILKDDPTSHVLVCGASNPSTDTLAYRLRSLSPSTLLRLNSPTRPLNEVRSELLPFCQVAGDGFEVPDLETLLSKRVICLTVSDCSMLLAARITNLDLATLQAYVATKLRPLAKTLSGQSENQSRCRSLREIETGMFQHRVGGEADTRETKEEKARPHFDYLLVDEAAQATEADLVPALAVVSTDPRLTSAPHVTLCGVPHQLGPHIVASVARDYELDVSLLERLLGSQVYRDHPYSRRNRGRNRNRSRQPHENGKLDDSSGAQAAWNLESTPFVDLVRNYRSVEEILWLPSTLFYHETLLPCASITVQETPLRYWSQLPNPSFPILFHHAPGEDFEIDEGSSFHNPSELAIVVRWIVDLVQGTGSDTLRAGEGRGTGVKVQAKEISVISPFREQVWRIRLALRRKGLGEVDVGNVEALQGAENRVVIISPVRSVHARWIEHDRQTNRGLIFEPKRFNVAMTRAKELLLVVGNAQTLCVDPNWRSFYHLCVRNRAFVGPPIVPGSSSGRVGPSTDETVAFEAVSKLEMDYRARGRGQHRRGDGRDGGNAFVDEEEEDGGIEVRIGRMVSHLGEGEDE
ncbi:hypothetical protein JCM10212_004066 [Sporobolomyces blumeae]